MSVSQKALVEYSKDSSKDNENSWSRTKEDNSNFISFSAYSKYSLYCLETSRQDKTKTWTKILVLVVREKKPEASVCRLHSNLLILTGASWNGWH